MKEQNETNKNNQEKKHREVYIVLLLLLVISVGFAVLSTNLSILGNTTISKQNWQVEFGEVKASEGTVPTTGKQISEMGTVQKKDGTSTTEVEFTADLKAPGDFYEFTVVVENNGTIDAMLDTIPETNNQLDEGQRKYLKYTVTYATTGDTVEKNDGIKAGEKATIKVRVEFKKDVEAADLPQGESTTISSTYALKYIQADTTANYDNQDAA